MQTRNPLIEQVTPSSEPVEIDPALWSEVAGGMPRNTWSTIESLFRSATELSVAEG